MQTLVDGFEHKYVVLLYSTRSQKKGWLGPFDTLEHAHKSAEANKQPGQRTTVALFTLGQEVKPALQTI